MFFKPYYSKVLRTKHRGQGVLEITASLIMFTIMIALTMSISAYLYTQHAFVTAARDGARKAAVNTDLGDPATEATGITDIQNEVIDSVAQLTGQLVDEDNITVTPPDAAGTPGDRTVSVVINFDMDNPVNIAGLLGAMGAGGDDFATIPIFSTATMRYEE